MPALTCKLWPKGDGWCILNNTEIHGAGRLHFLRLWKKCFSGKNPVFSQFYNSQQLSDKDYWAHTGCPITHWLKYLILQFCNFFKEQLVFSNFFKTRSWLSKIYLDSLYILKSCITRFRRKKLCFSRLGSVPK